jgi:hypothetical protein
MKKISVFILIIFLFSINFVDGQNSDKSSILSMNPSTLDKKVSILFQNDTFQIFTSTKVLEKKYGLPGDSASWPNHKSNLFIECYSNSDTLDLFTCSKQKSLDHVLFSWTANLFSKSDCVIYNRKTNAVVTKLVRKSYDRFDVGGTEYFTEDGHLLFRTIEWVY